MATSSSLPVLLPPGVQPSPETKPYAWRPTRNLAMPPPPPPDEMTPEMEMAAARLSMDGKVRKVRPRRTVDYGGPMGRWTLLRKLRPLPTYVPYLRPAPPYIIDLLPPKAYPENASTSLCTKFVHTSTNKIRCPVNCVTWTPEGRRVLTGSTSGEFTLWNGQTFNFETILQAHDTAVRTMQFSHSGLYLGSADQSGVIKYFQPNMNNLTAWQGHREAIRGLSFSPDDGRFATASDDSTIRIWSFEESREERVLTGHGWDVKCVEWHSTKGLLVSGSKDNMIKFWDPRTGRVLSTLHYHKNTIQALAWSPDGNLVASASRDQTVRVFDIRMMKEFQVLRGHKKEVCSVTWHPIHPILVSGGSEGAVLHWDLSAAADARPIEAPAVSAPASGTPAGAMTPQVTPRATLSQAHDSNVWSMMFHPLGHILVTASNDHTTRFWCRERPGDASSVFSGGGEKPPEASGQDDDEDAFVPGFSSGPGPSWDEPGGVPEGYAREEDSIPGFGSSSDGVPGLGSNAGGGGPPRQNGAGHDDGEEQWNRGGNGGGGGGGGYNGGGYSGGGNRGGGGGGGGGYGTRDGGDYGGRGGRGGGGRWGPRRNRY